MGAINTLKKMIRASALALIIFLLQASSCDKEEKEFVDIWPRMPVNISPPQELISIGDTLWLNIDFPDTVEDYLTKKFYKVENYDFFTSIMLLKLIGPTINRADQPAAASNFSFYQKIGSLINIGSLGGDLKFDYSGSRYKNKIGLVPKQSGVFSLIMLYRDSGKPFGEVVENISNDKKRIYYAHKLSYIINNGDFHFDLYQKNCFVDPDIKTVDPWFYELFSTYTFEVK